MTRMIATNFLYSIMKYLTIPPPTSLSEYVRFFWMLESDQPYEHRSLADGSIEMIFHYYGSFDEIKPGGNCTSAPSAIQGTCSQYHIYTTSSAFGIFGVYFYPYAIPVLFGMPTSELTNEMPDLHAFLKTDGRDLEERMMTAHTNSERVNIISAFLDRRIKKAEKTDAGLQLLIRSTIHSGLKTNIDFTAKAFSLSRRQFERRFKMLAGFSPKMYERIIRFQRVADEYNQRNKSLTQIALEYGYYDHSHFTNDFKKFSGHNPKDYFSGNETGYEWRGADTGMSQYSKN